MATVEEIRAEHEKALARASELRPRIVRAERWDQLFASPEVAQVDFQRYLVDGWRFYYINEGRDDPPVVYTVEPHPDGNIHRIARQKGYDTTYQRLPNGDVAQTFYYPDKPPKIDLITPSIGNIDHPFTNVDTYFPNNIIEALSEGPEHSVRLTFLASHLEGKPATQGWENTMLYNGYIPQRIGYRLFPDYALEELAQMRIQHPQIFSKT